MGLVNVNITFWLSSNDIVDIHSFITFIPTLKPTHQEVCDHKEVLRVLHRGWCFSNGGECQRRPVHAVGILSNQSTKLWICWVRIHKPVGTKT